MPAAMAFIHFVAAFAIVSALTVEVVLLRDALTIASAQRIRRADLAFGLAAAVILTAGVLRVVYFETGPEFYLHDVPFLIKMVLFALVGAVSIYPTMEFLSWRKVLDAGRVPVVPPEKLRRIRRILHWELVGILAIALCASLMAKGIGYFGNPS
jgi:putative membrane protein